MLVFEAAVAAALLWSGRVVTLANVAGGCFQLGLVLSGSWGLLNVALASGHVALRWEESQESAVQRRLRKQS